MVRRLLFWAGGDGHCRPVHSRREGDRGSGKHAIHVALWDARGFLDKAAREIRLEPGAPPNFRFDVPRGRWALSAFEDVNDNGKLDMGIFGPKEPSGFWRPFHAWRKPRFDDVAVEITEDWTGVEIRLGGKPTRP